MARIAIIGGGSIGEALLSGLLRAGSGASSNAKAFHDKCENRGRLGCL
ncbi:NAD(P)-binding domain-containing protein [Mycobacterium tuberculosis]